MDYPDSELVDGAIAALSAEYGAASMESLFEQRRKAPTRAWFWAINAVIQWRRGAMVYARCSWLHAMRLTLDHVAVQKKGASA